MDLFTLLHRCRLSHSPISLVVRLAESRLLDTALPRAEALLADRDQADEILVLVDEPCGVDVPAQKDGILIRFLVCEDALHGRALAKAFSACRRPLVVAVDQDVALTREELADVLGLLDGCDLVVGRRRAAFRWWAWPLEASMRWLFAVPVLDPLCPCKGMRRAAVADVILQSRGPLVDFELIAKLTALTTLIDETPLADHAKGSGLLRMMLTNIGGVCRLFFQPRFWAFDPGQQNFRPPLNAEPSSPLPKAQTVCFRHATTPMQQRLPNSRPKLRQTRRLGV